MNDGATQQGCPGDEAVAEVLDRTAAPAAAAALRAHVAACDACLARHGELFLLEVLAPALPASLERPALPTPHEPPAPPTRRATPSWRRRLVPAAAAALLLALALLRPVDRAPLVAAASAWPFQVAGVEWRERVDGPDGSRERRVEPVAAPRELYLVLERRTLGDGRLETTTRFTTRPPLE